MQNRVMRKVGQHLLPMFFCVALLCNLDRANLSFAAQQLSADLHFDKVVYGFGSGTARSSRSCMPLVGHAQD